MDGTVPKPEELVKLDKIMKIEDHRKIAKKFKANLNVNAFIAWMDKKLAEEILEQYTKLDAKYDNDLTEITCESDLLHPAVTSGASKIRFQKQVFFLKAYAEAFVRHTVKVGKTSPLIPENAYSLYIPTHEFFHTVFIKEMCIRPEPLAELTFIYEWHLSELLSINRMLEKEIINLGVARKMVDIISVGSMGLHDMSELFAEAMTVYELADGRNATADMVYEWARRWCLVKENKGE